MRYVNYLILGAGITGLSCAARLEKSKKTDYLVVEKESSVGGYCRTIEQDGFVWDYAGHFFHFNTPEMKAEFEEALCDSGMVVKAKSTKIHYKNRSIDYPFQYNIYQLEQGEFIECLVGLFSEKQAPPL